MPEYRATRLINTREADIYDFPAANDEEALKLLLSASNIEWNGDADLVDCDCPDEVLALDRRNSDGTYDSRRELTEALAASPQRSRLKTFVSEQIARHPDDCPHVDLDFTASVFGGDAYLIILQDIVRRSKGALPYLTIAAAYTCSKMRPDGFGGMGITIAPRAIRYWSTYDVLERFTARFEKTRARKFPPSAQPQHQEAASP
jgi:hypothetical protein